MILWGCFFALLTVFPIFCSYTLAEDPIAPAEFVNVSVSVPPTAVLDLSVSGSFLCDPSGISVENGRLRVTCSGGAVFLEHSGIGLVGQGPFVSLCSSGTSSGSSIKLINSVYGPTDYSGTLIFSVSGGKLFVTNRVPLSDYLENILQHNFQAPVPSEAVKALAVVARSALQADRASGTGGTDFPDTDPVFYGTHTASAATLEAVRDVSGKTLLYQGSPVRLLFCRSNGGYSKNDTQQPLYASRYDPFDFSAGKYNTSLKINAETGLLSKPVYAFLLSELQKNVCADSVERIRSVSLSGGGSESVRNTSVSFLCIYKDEDGVLKQALFSVPVSQFVTAGLISANSNRCFIRNTGGAEWNLFFSVASGYGTGLSFSGAQARAAAGESCEDILSFYYPGAVLSG